MSYRVRSIVGPVSVGCVLDGPEAGATVVLLEPQVTLRDRHEVDQPATPVPHEPCRVVRVPEAQLPVVANLHLLGVAVVPSAAWPDRECVGDDVTGVSELSDSNRLDRITVGGQLERQREGGFDDG